MAVSPGYDNYEGRSVDIYKFKAAVKALAYYSFGKGESLFIGKRRPVIHNRNGKAAPGAEFDKGLRYMSAAKTISRDWGKYGSARVRLPCLSLIYLRAPVS